MDGRSIIDDWHLPFAFLSPVPQNMWKFSTILHRGISAKWATHRLQGLYVPSCNERFHDSGEFILFFICSIVLWKIQYIIWYHTLTYTYDILCINTLKQNFVHRTWPSKIIAFQMATMTWQSMYIILIFHDAPINFRVEISWIMTVLERWASMVHRLPTRISFIHMTNPGSWPWRTVDQPRTAVNSISRAPNVIGWIRSTLYLGKYWTLKAC